MARPSVRAPSPGPPTIRIRRDVSPVLAAALTVVAAVAGCNRGPPAAVAGGGGPDTGTVVHVVDGDTVDVRIGGRVERVRLLGIDTPESVAPDRPVECYGPEASQLTASLVPEGTAVRLERDEEARDAYGRLLAYVFRVDDGLFVNEAILAAGAAEILSIEPNHAYASRLAAVADAARRDGRGRWGAC